MGSSRQPNLLTGKKAGADLSASSNLWKAVKLDANGDIVLATAGTGIGFLANLPESGDFAEVAVIGGGAKGVSAASLNEGDNLKSDANGDLVAATVANDLVIAIALESAVDNDIFEVLPVFLRIHA